jgi:hypothetical protein
MLHGGGITVDVGKLAIIVAGQVHDNYMQRRIKKYIEKNIMQKECSG